MARVDFYPRKERYMRWQLLGI